LSLIEGLCALHGLQGGVDIHRRIFPNPEPTGRVEYVFICMEPSLGGGWARDPEKARTATEAGFRICDAQGWLLRVAIVHAQLPCPDPDEQVVQGGDDGDGGREHDLIRTLRPVEQFAPVAARAQGPGHERQRRKNAEEPSGAATGAQGIF
jgi:hypothetical protein